MQAEPSTSYWWPKSARGRMSSSKTEGDIRNLTLSTFKHSDDPSTISSSLKEFLHQEEVLHSPDEDTDIGSIIEEISRIAAQSPLGPYELEEDRSVEELMKEAEKIYMESSRSFDQLSARSRTSASVSVSLNDTAKSTPTPNIVSPLPLDNERANERGEADDSYSEDFTDETDDGDANDIPVESIAATENVRFDLNATFDATEVVENPPVEEEISSTTESAQKISQLEQNEQDVESPPRSNANIQQVKEIHLSNQAKLIDHLHLENKQLKGGLIALQVQLEKAGEALAEAERTLKSESANARTVAAMNEDLKDAQERNAALQLQLDTLAESQQLLKVSYEEMLSSNGDLQKRLTDSETILAKYKQEIETIHVQKDNLSESESSLRELLDLEKLQVKSLKVQSEKDARCIQDLNRQVKEMERIIARKHPDSVSALIVAAKNTDADNNITARKLLEDRIKNLEEEVKYRDEHSSKIFLEVQEKFTEMKSKYESHIEDLELHVNDLKDQLKLKGNSFDVYTQTFSEDAIPVREGKDFGVQVTLIDVNKEVKAFGTQTNVIKENKKKKIERGEFKEDLHLLATIRGLKADLAAKDKLTIKLQKELDEAKKTKRVQKEREGNMKSAMEKKISARGTEDHNCNLEEELKMLKDQRDKMKAQLCKMEDDYQQLKTKRLFDLSTLQEAHENEIATYIAPLREQLELRQLTITSLQEQLSNCRKKLELLTAEKIEVSERLRHAGIVEVCRSVYNGNENVIDIDELSPTQKFLLLEQRYQDRENRLRGIIQGLSQKSLGNVGGCQHCAARHQELVLYKSELDQILATLRTLA